MRLLIISLISLGCFAQIVVPGPSGTTTTPTTTPAATTSTVSVTCDASGNCSGKETKVAATSTSNSWFGVGISYGTTGSPNISGVYAHQIASSLYSYNELLVTHIQKSPLSLQTSAMTGIADHVYKIGPVDIFAFVEAGSATAGTSTGYAASGGGCAYVKPWKNKEWAVIISAQPLKTNLGGFSAIYTIMLGR